MSVNDPCTSQVVRGELDSNPVARVDSDSEAPHLASYMAEDRLCAFGRVVECNTKHCVGKGLDDLSLHLDFFFFRQCNSDPKSRGNSRY